MKGLRRRITICMRGVSQRGGTVMFCRHNSFATHKILTQFTASTEEKKKVKKRAFQIMETDKIRGLHSLQAEDKLIHHITRVVNNFY